MRRATRDPFLAKALEQTVQRVDKVYSKKLVLDIPCTFSPLDFYALLRIRRDASSSDIKIAYHQILFHSHPDKQSRSARHPESQSSADIALLKEAYKTLVDPSSRAAYDKLLRRQDESSQSPRPAQIVSLEDFVVHPDCGDEDGFEQEWYYACRCGGTYRITENDLESGRHLVGCESCSEVIWVGYQVAEDQDDN
ncbi:hypothetical protein F5I97DRAFT_1241567 [Phlebopus sp. FC_14]|nr:hypothetical protein F5I97DRAFT_1241567 [Phlebopus sp. FC_14]